jgi:hypothetical protein
MIHRCCCFGAEQQTHSLHDSALIAGQACIIGHHAKEEEVKVRHGVEVYD